MPHGDHDTWGWGTNIIPDLALAAGWQPSGLARSYSSRAVVVLLLLTIGGRQEKQIKSPY
jgi:hypothetical protein